VDVMQSVHDALDGNASQRPAAERDVKATLRPLQLLGSVHPEYDPPVAGALSRFLDGVGVGVERVDVRRMPRGELRQPALPATDVDDALATQVDDAGDRGRLRALAVAPPCVSPA
jgi:hypothetical protein